jgi:hypothetical protein
MNLAILLEPNKQKLIKASKNKNIYALLFNKTGFL